MSDELEAKQIDMLIRILCSTYPAYDISLHVNTAEKIFKHLKTEEIAKQLKAMGNE